MTKTGLGTWRNARISAHVGPGWVPIVDTLYEEMRKVDPCLIVDQVKEKFGGLRFYYTPSSDLGEERRERLRALVQSYESVAAQTCEACGEQGKQCRSERGWLKTLCETDLERWLRGERVF